MNKILIMAGGTGGHVFPGLAVAGELTRNSEAGESWQVLWLGARGRMEEQLVPKHGYRISYIHVSGIRRNGLMKKLTAPFMIVRAVMESISIIRDYRPDVVLGFGGFASGPGGVASKLLGIPLVLHEQNAAPGLTNRVLSHIADRVLLGFPGAIKRSDAELVGNPVRNNVVRLHDNLPRSFDKPELRIIIIGGSLGAEILNETVPKMAALLFKKDVKFNIVHQTGRGQSAKVRAYYTDLKVPDSMVEISDFIDDMASAYENADLIICRAGALTVAEVSAAALPAIFVPLPSAVDDHQTKNARSLSDRGAALTMPQSEMTPETLAAEVEKLYVSREILSNMSKKSGDLAVLDAAARVAAVVRELSTSSKY